jgi:cytochrome c-type biogenesis protein CcmH/NrfG
VLSAVLLFYLVTLGWRAVALIRQGGLLEVLLGLGILALPLLGGWALWRELRFGRATEHLARDLEARGLLPEDTLPRRPSGRPDRAAADAWFEQFRTETATSPDQWESWFRLACAYDAAGDRKRARAAMRHAISLRSAGPPFGWSYR